MIVIQVHEYFPLEWMFITEVTANFSGKIAFKLISTIFLREKYMPKINTKETKTKQIQWSLKLEKIASWSSDFIYRDL